ncbi:MAG: NADH:ubiquinone reductase (Na(+)-transporting) subunit B [Gammaproteobacteria bacterium]|nr:NADH:ubiquinone reductase (Na(+)-transporting) subunit B [Gammaproteobacteria bacterium]
MARWQAMLQQPISSVMRGGSWFNSITSSTTAGSQTVSLVTQVAPHIRDGVNLKWTMNCVLLSLIPSVLFGLYNTGYQANIAMAYLNLQSAPGWRGMLLDALHTGYEAPSVVASVAHGLLYLLPAFMVASLVGGFWETIFARLRKHEATDGFLVTALLFTLLLPPAAPLWQVALGISFGIVIGKEIFGGTGKNFLNPTLVGLAFLHLAYPNEMAGHPLWTNVAGYNGTSIFGAVAAGGMEVLPHQGISWLRSFAGLQQGTLGATSPLACLLGTAFLIYAGVASWRIMLSALIGVIASALMFNLFASDLGPIFQMPWYWHLTLGSFAFGVVFLATDPASSAMTNTGRWIYGLLIGFMVVLIRAANPVHPDGVMLAILLGNIFAPLIDYFVTKANIRRRERRSV